MLPEDPPGLLSTTANSSTIKKFVDIRKADLQEVIDTCPLKHSSLELILSLFKGMYSYALQNDIVEKDYSQFVTVVELLGLEGLLLSLSN